MMYSKESFHGVLRMILDLDWASVNDGMRVLHKLQMSRRGYLQQGLEIVHGCFGQRKSPRSPKVSAGAPCGKAKWMGLEGCCPRCSKINLFPAFEFSVLYKLKMTDCYDREYSSSR